MVLHVQALANEVCASMRLHHCWLTIVQAEMLPCNILQLQEFNSSISARFCQRAAKKRVRANRKTQLVSRHCDISWQKANESLQRSFSLFMWEVLIIKIYSA